MSFLQQLFSRRRPRSEPQDEPSAGGAAAAADPEAAPAHEAALAERLAALEAEVAGLRRLVSEAPDLLSRHTPEGRILYVAPAAPNLLGYSPEEMVGRSIFEFFHPDDVYRSKRAQEQAARAPDVYTATYRVRHRDGHYLWLETSSRVLIDPDTGQASDIITVSRDVSGRDHERLALRENEAMYRRAFEEAPLGMVLAEANTGALLRVNRQFCEMLGYSRSELRELSSRDITHPGDGNLIVSLAAGSIGQEEFPLHRPKRFLRKDGSTLQAMMNLQLVRDEQGAPVYFVSLVSLPGDDSADHSSDNP